MLGCCLESLNIFVWLSVLTVTMLYIGMVAACIVNMRLNPDMWPFEVGKRGLSLLVCSGVGPC